METVDVYIPIHDGLSFPIAEVCLSIRPNEDCAFKWGIAADVTYEDTFTGKWHAMPTERAERILDDIRANDGDKWAMIERAARLNSRPGCDDEDREPVSYTPHWAEDELATLECPR